MLYLFLSFARQLKTIYIIMKKNNRHTWILRCFNTFSGEVFYKIRHLLTVREAEAFASELLENNPSICVSLFKKHKMDQYG